MALSYKCHKSGDVVIQDVIRGVAATVGNVGDTVAVSVESVYGMAKAAATVFTAGAAMGWDGTNKVASAGGATGNLGDAAGAAASGATSVNVRLCPGIA